jgi:hypothetical protein
MTDRKHRLARPGTLAAAIAKAAALLTCWLATGTCSRPVPEQQPAPDEIVLVGREQMARDPVAALAVDAEHLYFGQDGGVMRLPKSGGKAVPVARVGGSVSDVHVDATHVYWAAMSGWGRTVSKAPKSGGAPESIGKASRLERAPGRHIAIDDEYVYWTRPGRQRPMGGGARSRSDAAGFIMKTPKRGGPAVVVETREFEPQLVTVDGEYVYYVDEGVERVAKTGGRSRVLAWERPTALAVGPDAVYAADWLAGWIKRIPKNGGPATVIGRGHYLSRLTWYGDALYVLDEGSVGFGCGPLINGAVVRYRPGEEPVALFRRWAVHGGLALDADRVYWADLNGSVRSASREPTRRP